MRDYDGAKENEFSQTGFSSGFIGLTAEGSYSYRKFSSRRGMDRYSADESISLALTGGSAGLEGVSVVTQSVHAQKKSKISRKKVICEKQVTGGFLDWMCKNS